MSVAPSADAALLDPTTPLPRTGFHLIEASAGTGKTHALTTLALRALLEPPYTPTARLLAVTFTHEAAGELRHRIRQRLQGIVTALATGRNCLDDDLIAIAGEANRSDEFERRVHHALADLDDAVISTIHGFAHQIVRGSGLITGPSLTLRTDVSDLEAAIVTDQLAEHALGTYPVAPTAKKMIDTLARARNRPGTRVLPEHEDDRLSDLEEILELLDGDNEDEGLATTTLDRVLELWDRSGTSHVDLARRKKVHTRRKAVEEAMEHAIAAELMRRSIGEVHDELLRAGELGFNDLLVEAAGVLGDTDRAAELGGRFDVLLIDEFQDTDPVQWEMLSGLRRPDNVLIAVGDPKQAIYRFRGGDIATYGRARAGAEQVTSLTTNHRSNPAVVAALNHLLDGANFGPGIDYQPVIASPSAPAAQDGAPISICLVDPTDAGAQRREIAADLARHVEHTIAASGIGRRDTAVLYRSHGHGHDIVKALAERGIPAVINRGENVLDSPALAWWQNLLWALERPSDTGRVKAAALTPFFGLAVSDLIESDPIRELQRRLLRLNRELERRGVTHLTQQLLRDDRCALNLARRTDGERALVDVMHLAELLHMATEGRAVGARAVREALDRLRFADPDDPEYASELTRRRLDNETDDDVVRVMSVHQAKGLQFDFVCCPTLWTAIKVTAPYEYEDDQGRPVLHFERDGEPKSRARENELAENARLTYVALTRAVHRLSIWWPASDESKKKKGPKAPSTGLDLILSHLGHDSTDGALRAIADERPDLIEVRTTDVRSRRRPEATSTTETAPDLATATIGRELDRTVERLSFSTISAVAFPYEERDRTDHGDPELDPDAGSTDERPDEILDPIPEPTVTAVPLADLPAGQDAGTRLHAIFEHLDFAQPTALPELLDAEFPSLDAPSRERILTGLRQVLDTPLPTGRSGSAHDTVRLSDIAETDRLDELVFDLPVRFGLEQAVTLPALGEVIRRHADDDPQHGALLREWSDRLVDPRETRRLGGWLTGSIDLFFRHRTPTGDTRYLVADYKSNRVARWPEPLTPDVYVPTRLGEEMLHGHYLLQALLYQLAANRFLAHRLRDYDPAVHLGPTLYLFVRGMTGDTTPTGESHGVFSWRPSDELLAEADALLLRPAR